MCREADLIIHAGDLSEASILQTFEAFGPPVIAVRGNVDSEELQHRLPESHTLKVESVAIGVIHDAGPRKGRLARLRAAFPGTQAVIFGHSHLPLQEEEGDFQIFNPGSPTERRRSPCKSMGLATVAGTKISFELIDLGT